jgi:hypothetical protein
MERFFDGINHENSKTQGGKGQIRKIHKNKKERIEERKRRDFLHTWRFPYSCVLHRSGTPWGYHPHATFPQENLLELEPPLQLSNEQSVGSCSSFSWLGLTS